MLKYFPGRLQFHHTSSAFLNIILKSYLPLSVQAELVFQTWLFGTQIFHLTHFLNIQLFCSTDGFVQGILPIYELNHQVLPVKFNRHINNPYHNLLLRI